MGQEKQEIESVTVHQEKTRNCLMCLESFESAWAGERVCKRCKSSGTWRGGADFEAA